MESVYLYVQDSHYVTDVKSGWTHSVKVEYYVREDVAEVQYVRFLHTREFGHPAKSRHIVCLQE